MISRLLVVITALCIFSTHISAQVLPLENSIYEFLDRLSLKYQTGYSRILNPKTRGEISRYLDSLKTNDASMSDTEREQLNFYLQELKYERQASVSEFEEKKFNILNREEDGRLAVFEYSANDFYLNVNPLFQVENSNNKTNTFFWNSGIYAYGYYNKDWGFSFRLRDNHLYGSQLDRERLISRKTGYGFKNKLDSGFDFDDVNAEITYNWSAGFVSIRKEHINIGSGKESNIILSSKAPSFPHIDFTFYPVDWFKFKYIYAILQSGVLDSGTVRNTLIEKKTVFNSISKYLVSHYLEIIPFSWMNIMLGESIVYSEQVKPLYFIPLLFFRFADHYTDDKSNSGDNAQLYADISLKIPQVRAEIYSTLYIDELSFKSLYEGGNLASVGYTLGIQQTDPVFANSKINIEYTRLNPFVYRNGEPAEEYTSYGYQLGHWIGSNADIVSLKYYQQLTRPLSFIIDSYYFRKGQRELPKEQYTLPYPGFLYGARRNEFFASFTIQYEFLHTLIAQLSYTFTKISDEDNKRTLQWQLGKKHTASLFLSYGL